MRLTTIELFAGAGGLALGVEKAGFKTLACLEFNADACASLRANRPRWRVVEDDIANVSCLDLEDYFGIILRQTLRALCVENRRPSPDYNAYWIFSTFPSTNWRVAESKLRPMA